MTKDKIVHENILWKVKKFRYKMTAVSSDELKIKSSKKQIKAKPNSQGATSRAFWPMFGGPVCMTAKFNCHASPIFFPWGQYFFLGGGGGGMGGWSKYEGETELQRVGCTKIPGIPGPNLKLTPIPPLKKIPLLPGVVEV